MQSVSSNMSKSQRVLPIVNALSTLQVIISLQMVFTAFEGAEHEESFFLLSKLFFFIGLAFDGFARVLLIGVETDDENREVFSVGLVACSFYAKCLTIAVVFLAVTLREM